MSDRFVVLYSVPDGVIVGNNQGKVSFRPMSFLTDVSVYDWLDNDIRVTRVFNQPGVNTVQFWNAASDELKRRVGYQQYRFQLRSYAVNAIDCEYSFLAYYSSELKTWLIQENDPDMILDK